MTTELEQAKELFLLAIDVAAHERESFLADRCGDDVELRRNVDQLLRGHNDGLSLVDRVVTDETKDDGASEFTGTQIGPYKLLETIGEGGMGTVYMAQQSEPIRRRVAVKVIKTGMDTRQVIARFEAERQTLAMMDHPNISKVLDAGSTESGRPYFVMELVKGIPITKFCDQQQMGLKQRLELFRQVCHGVQHAHQKGIIHRDLKPSNVLVAMYDDRPVVKVIDFGVAKATGDQLTEKTMFTRFGQVVGTLEYMSPEQAQFNQLDIDTRSDIYSLGAILCELISGEPPFNQKRMKSQALDETLRMIREEEPTKPSTKLSSSAQLAQVASNRNTSAERLNSQLRGDLDWIVMKALDKDRARRFETASGMALDLEHYLADEPVTATPPSTKYRLRKFARRNKTMLAFVSTIGVGLLAAIIGLSISNRMISKRENEKQDAVQIAEQNFQRAQDAVDNYLVKVSEERLLNTPGMQSLRKELLELALQYYKEFIEQQPGDEAAHYDLALAFHRIGSIKRELGEHQNAIDAQLRCIELLDKPIVRNGEGSNLEMQADAYDDLSRSCYALMSIEKAIEYFRKEVQVREEIVNLEPDSQQKKRKLARSYLGETNILRHLRTTSPNFGEATNCSDQAIAIAKDLILLDGANLDNQFLMGLVTSNQATLLVMQGKLEEAFKWFQTSIKHLETCVEEDPEKLEYQHELASTFRSRGSAYGRSNQIEKALLDLLAAIEFQRRWIEQNPDLIEDRILLCGSYLMATECYLRLKRFEHATTNAELAVKNAEVAVESQPAFPGPQVFLANSREKLARCYYGAGRYEDAANLLTVVIESFETGLGGYERQKLDGAIESEKEAREEHEQVKRKRMARLFFQMSMAHWELENKDVALGFFEKAVANVDADFPGPLRDELETEASALLGVEPPNRKSIDK